MFILATTELLAELAVTYGIVPLPNTTSDFIILCELDTQNKSVILYFLHLMVRLSKLPTTPPLAAGEATVLKACRSDIRFQLAHTLGFKFAYAFGFQRAHTLVYIVNSHLAILVRHTDWCGSEHFLEMAHQHALIQLARLVEPTDKPQGNPLIEAIELWEECLGKLPGIEVVRHIEELHAKHSHGNGVAVYFVLLVKVVYISKDSVVEDRAREIRVFRAFVEIKILLVKLRVALHAEEVAGFDIPYLAPTGNKLLQAFVVVRAVVFPKPSSLSFFNISDTRQAR